MKKLKKLSKTVLVLIIIAELACGAAECVAINNLAWEHIVARRTAAVTSAVCSFDPAPLTKNLKKQAKKAKESVGQVVDETVWTTDSVNYRTGPGEKYDRIGTLGAYASVKRTGITLNGWSRVEVDGESCYILSEYLTTEMPLITAGGQKGEYQRYALSQLANYGWDDSEIVPLIQLWNRESGWNPNSHNKRSGAHGIPQALPASKMASEGSDYYTNGNTQIRWGLGYIARRYGSPSNAWRHFQSRGWY